MVTRLILIRHGNTDWNAGGIFQGQADVDLNSTGKLQAVQAAPLVASYQPTALYSSPLKRAKVTAAAVADLTGLSVQCDKRLAEINVGTWSGLTIAEVQELDPEFALASRRGEDYRRSLTGETLMECGTRVAGALQEIATNHPGENTVIASHGQAIRFGISQLLGWDFATTSSLGVMDNCGVATVVLFNDNWRLESYNRH